MHTTTTSAATGRSQDIRATGAVLTVASLLALTACGGSSETEQQLTDAQIDALLIAEHEVPFSVTGDGWGTWDLSRGSGLSDEFGAHTCFDFLEGFDDQFGYDDPAADGQAEYIGEVQEVGLAIGSFPSEVDTSESRENLVASCDGESFESGADALQFDEFEAEGFHGVEIKVRYEGEERQQFIGFRDHGHNLVLFVYAAEGLENLETAERIAEVQSEKLEAGLPEGVEEDADDGDGAAEDEGVEDLVEPEEDPASS